MAERSTERVVVFIDWQDPYKGARDAFHDDRAPSRLGMVDPVRAVPRMRIKQQAVVSSTCLREAPVSAVGLTLWTDATSVSYLPETLRP
jgi:hypothetical protein